MNLRHGREENFYLRVGKKSLLNLHNFLITIRDAEEEYGYTKDDYWKDWDDLSSEEKEKWYAKYATTHNLKDYSAKTYDEYMRNGDLETFVQRYTSKSGDKIVAFGEYGYDG